MNRAEYEAAREHLHRIENDAMCATQAAILRMELSKGFDSDELDATKKAALAGQAKPERDPLWQDQIGPDEEGDQ